MKIKLTGLWLHSNFKRLWAGQAASQLGMSLSTIALPLTAVVVLDASPIQMGIVGAMAGVPAFIGVFMGVWIDRRRRMPVLVGADAGRMLLLLAIPVAHVMDVLTMELIYGVSLGIGALSMAYEIAYRSFLPSVVTRRQLVEANSKLEVATSGSVAVGPGLGGVLVQAVSAPFALIFGAAIYAISALMFRSIRVVEAISISAPNVDEQPESMIAGIRDGLVFFRRNQMLIGLVAAGATLMLFGAAYDAIYILYMVRELEFSAGMVGAVFSLGSIGLLGGSFMSAWLTKRIGVGRALTIGFVVMGVGGFAVPLAQGPIGVAFGILVFGEISFLLGLVIWNIGQVSIRQATTPDHLLGRVTSMFVVAAGAVTLPGALVGGFLGEYLGLRGAMFVFAAGISLSLVWLIVFKVWNIREMPEDVGGDVVGEGVLVPSPSEEGRS